MLFNFLYLRSNQTEKRDISRIPNCNGHNCEEQTSFMIELKHINVHMKNTIENEVHNRSLN